MKFIQGYCHIVVNQINLKIITGVSGGFRGFRKLVKMAVEVESEVLLSLSQAFDVLGAKANKSTRTQYRVYLGLEAGQGITPEDLRWLHKMIFWCRRGRGGRNTEYSRDRFNYLRFNNAPLLEQKLKELGYVEPNLFESSGAIGTEAKSGSVDCPNVWA